MSAKRKKLVVNFHEQQLELFALGETGAAIDEHWTVADKYLICQHRRGHYYSVALTQRMFTNTPLRAKTTRLSADIAEKADPLRNWQKGGF